MRPELVLKDQAEFEQIHKCWQGKGAHLRHAFGNEPCPSLLSRILEISGR